MIIPHLVQQNVPLADKNWFKTGGVARYFAQPTNAHEFQQALKFAKSHQIPIFLLGKGANILISDEGFNGLVIRSQLVAISHTYINDTTAQVTAGAGVDLHDLIQYCFAHNIVGLEEFSGIPSTVGGAAYINLHYFEFLLEQFLTGAQVIDAATTHIETVDNSWFGFGYNNSKLHVGNHYLMNATFTLKRANDLEIAYARGRSVEIIRHRSRRYPTQNTCGSFFRNFHEHEISFETEGKKLIFVAYYFDKLGFKGTLSIGDAQVSHQHANMIVNRGAATSTDIILLARAMQEQVKNAYGIVPQPECRLIGFSSYPLW